MENYLQEIKDLKKQLEKLKIKNNELENKLINSQNKWVRDELADVEGYIFLQFDTMRIEVHLDLKDENGEDVPFDDETIIGYVEFNFNDKIEDIDKKIMKLIETTKGEENE